MKDMLQRQVLKLFLNKTFSGAITFNLVAEQAALTTTLMLITQQVLLLFILATPLPSMQATN
jgi:hypothetical protein